MASVSFWSMEKSLEILACPISSARLRRPDKRERETLRALGRSSGLPEGAYIFGVSEDGMYAYAEHDGIALMLPRQAIRLKAAGPDYFDRDAEWKQSVAGFYDTVGWTFDESGEFVDSCRFEDVPTCRGSGFACWTICPARGKCSLIVHLGRSNSTST
jgi:uncharacterized protein YbaR (Trm112 family)